MNEAMPLIIGLVIFIIIAVVGGLFLLKMLNATKSQASKDVTGKPINEPHKNSTQAFLPYDEIMGNLIRIGNEYRCILKVSSVNYQLMTEFEQDALESSFKSLIDSMDYVFAFYIQTRELDTRVMIEKFKEDYEKLKETMPKCLEYAEEFINTFSEGNFDGVIVKNKYLILCSDDFSHMTALSNEERAEIAAEQLTQRMANAQNALRNIGLNCELLKEHELIELIVLGLDKSLQGSLDGLTNGEYLKDMVESAYEIKDEAAFNIEAILKEFENRLRMLEIEAGIDDEQAKRISDISRDITKMRMKYSKVMPKNTKEKTDKPFAFEMPTVDSKKVEAKIEIIQDEEDDDYFEL